MRIEIKKKAKIIKMRHSVIREQSLNLSHFMSQKSREVHHPNSDPLVEGEFLESWLSSEMTSKILCVCVRARAHGRAYAHAHAQSNTFNYPTCFTVSRKSILLLSVIDRKKGEMTLNSK